MGDLRSVGWLVVVGACTAAAPSPPPGVECTPSASSTSALAITAISPQLVALHGGDVELAFDGAMPPDQTIDVNGVPATLDGSTLHVPASARGSGPLSIHVGDDPANPIASLDCAGHYAETPDSVGLDKGSETLAIPLHPELAHECARTGVVQVTNSGDEPLVLFPQLTGSPGFQTVFAEPTCPLPLYFDSCDLVMCFSSNVPSVQTAHLAIPSTMATASLDFAATVLPQTPGLDVAVWRPYKTLQQEAVRGVTTLSGGAVAIWDESPATAFDLVAANGAPAPHDVGAPVIAMRAGAAGQGIYAIAGDTQHRALVHFDNTGTRDTADVSLAADAAALAVGSSVMVIGSSTVTSYAGGAIAGTVDFSARGTFTGASALDASGRLYVATTGGLVRIANGAIDSTFVYTGAVTALAPPLAAAGASLVSLDDSGAATALASAAHPITDLATDASGRIYAITIGGQLTRYLPDGEPDRVHSFDGASHLACPATGDCAVVGLANGLDKYLIELAP
jgi:hypothetical protein